MSKIVVTFAICASPCLLRFPSIIISYSVLCSYSSIFLFLFPLTIFLPVCIYQNHKVLRQPWLYNGSDKKELRGSLPRRFFWKSQATWSGPNVHFRLYFICSLSTGSAEGKAQRLLRVNLTSTTPLYAAQISQESHRKKLRDAAQISQESRRKKLRHTRWSQHLIIDIFPRNVLINLLESQLQNFSMISKKNTILSQT